MKTVTLDTKQRQELLGRRPQTGERRLFQRLSALLGIDEGRTREEVAELLGLTSRQVGDWLRIFRTKGLDELCTLHYRGDPGRSRPAQIERLRQEIATGAFHNAEQVRAWIEEQFGVTSSGTRSCRRNWRRETRVPRHLTIPTSALPRSSGGQFVSQK